MAEDWRVTGTLGGELAAVELMHRLHVHETELPQRVAASHDGAHIFVYADTRDAAGAAARELRKLEPGTAWTVTRWHPEEERWEDPGVPLPATPEEHAREHAALEALETEESQQTGLAEWEVRVEFPTHHEAHAFAERERAEGRSIARRWKYVLIGLDDRDDAEELAKRLQTRLPSDAVLHVEPGSGLAWELAGASPFAVFGGLGM